MMSHLFFLIMVMGFSLSGVMLLLVVVLFFRDDILQVMRELREMPPSILGREQAAKPGFSWEEHPNTSTKPEESANSSLKLPSDLIETEPMPQQTTTTPLQAEDDDPDHSHDQDDEVAVAAFHDQASEEKASSQRLPEKQRDDDANAC